MTDQEKEIQRCNKNITIFMGYSPKYSELTNGQLGLYFERTGWEFNISEKIGESRFYYVPQLEYDRNYEWLMKVVEVISKTEILDENKQVKSFHFRTFGMRNLETDNFMFRIDSFQVHEDEDFITGLYNSITEFIDWYLEYEEISHFGIEN